VAPQQRSARTRTAARGAVALLALLAAACGGSTAGGKPATIVAAAPERTIAAGPAAVRIDRFGLHAEGVVDLAKDAVRLTVDGVSGPALEVLAVGPRTWTRPVGATAWSQVETVPELLSLPGGLRSGDPRAAVALVRGASKVTVFGGLQVQQTSTIRYDLRVDPQQAATLAPAGPQAELRALAAAVAHTVRVDVYVDGEGRIRRLEVPEDLLSVTPTTRVDGNRISATIDLLHFGVPADGLDPPT
jgi:hypothetical protein